MRLLGRRRDRCDCRLCRPDPVVEPGDRKALYDVEHHGVHVVLVSDAACCADHEPSGEPDFAYTVGLWHHRRHPELLISGLQRPEVMHRAVDDLARWVREGEVLQPGRAYEDVLRGVAVTVEELTPAAARGMATWSQWFHRRDVPVLQVVWPDGEGLFAWQEDASPLLDEKQPPQWRVPGPRTGALAPEPDWPFPVGPDTQAFCCPLVVDGELPALYVQRDADPERGEDWCVGCGAEDEDAEHGIVLAHLWHAVVRNPGLRETADLALGCYAERADPRSPWQVWRTPPEDD